MSPSDITAEILAMAADDQRMRKSRPDPAVDWRNTARMKEIIDVLGWPTRTKIGERAEHMALLLVQHADFDLAWQKRCLALMGAEPPDEVCPAHLAYLEDRIRIAEGRPQRFGTQFRPDGKGGLEPEAIEDPAGLDERRSSAGLEPFSYRDQMRQAVTALQAPHEVVRRVALANAD